MTLIQIGMYLSHLPEIQRRREAGNAIVAWLLAAVHGNESEVGDWYSGYSGGDQNPYISELGRDIRTAIRLGLMSQDMLDMLDAERLFKAFKVLAKQDLQEA